VTPVGSAGDTGVRWIALTGFMGAGKTSVGRRVANRLNAPFVDADRAIEEEVGLTIPEIFSQKGELWFRRIEEATIRGVLASEPAGVISLGGGAAESAKTRDLLSREAWVVWLSVDVDVAWNRVKHSTRPLAQDYDAFARRATAREDTYRAIADLQVDANEPTDEVSTRVTAWAHARRREEVAR
jgi:shikimate kinase